MQSARNAEAAPPDGPAFTCRADIEALERLPYEQAIPARNTYGLIARAARIYPERTAFVYLPDGELATPPRRIDYRELLAQVHRAANAFRAFGVGPGDAVAILAPNLPETQFALWGAQLAGIACPINFMLQPEHVATLLAAAHAKLVVALAPHPELDLWQRVEAVLRLHPLPVVQIDVGTGLAPGVPTLQSLLSAQAETLGFDPQLAPERVAALFHTGGTTGAPKLAIHTHGNEAHTAWFAHRFYDFDADTVEVNGFPLFHVAGAFVYGLALLAIGACQVLPTPTGLRNAGFMRRYWKFCERERVTALACVPTILAALIDTPIDANVSRVRIAYTGGSPLPNELAARFEAVTGLPVRNILGMTESAGLVSIEPARAPRVPGSVGLRLPYTEVRAVAWRDGAARLDEPCGPGETGVIVLHGPHVGPGYTDQARNDGMFEAGWLISGDLGHVDTQGYVHVTGRSKDVIIRGAHNLDPGLIEEAFLADPAVALCAVVGEPDAHAGELPVGFVTLKPGVRVEPAALLARVASQVYERPAVPRRVTVIDAMPMTAIGKVYKPALRVRAAAVKLGEVLAAIEPQGRARVEVVDAGGAPLATVTLEAPESGPLAEAVRRALAPMPLRIEYRYLG